MAFRIPELPGALGEQSDEEGTNAVTQELKPVRDSERASLSDEEIFDVLRNSRRRAVLSHLFQTGGEASLSDLTTHVAAEEYGVDAEQISPQQRNSVYTGLSQCHLSRMDELGVIDFDDDEKTATLREPAAEIESYLVRDSGTTAVRPVLALAVVVAAVVTLGVAGVGPLGHVPAATWTLFTAFALTGVALFNLSV